METIKEVISKADSNKWIKFGPTLYTNFKNYVPHLRQDIAKVFNPEKNRAFKTGNAKRWLALDEKGQVVGKIAAFTNKKYSKGMEQGTGGLGFFECIDNEKVAHLLFDVGIHGEFI